MMLILKVLRVFGLFATIMIAGFFMRIKVCEWIKCHYDNSKADDFTVIILILGFILGLLFVASEIIIIASSV